MFQLKTLLFPGFALILAGWLSGCASETVQQSRVAITNLHGDGLTQTNLTVSYAAGGQLTPGTARTVLCVAGQGWLVFYHPATRLNQVLPLTAGDQGQAWLVSTQSVGSTRRWAEVFPPDNVAFQGVPLAGRVELAQYDWRHRNLFHVGADLTGPSGLVVKCEFTRYEKSRFDAKQLWLDPYLVLFGPFVKW